MDDRNPFIDLATKPNRSLESIFFPQKFGNSIFYSYICSCVSIETQYLW